MLMGLQFKPQPQPPHPKTSRFCNSNGKEFKISLLNSVSFKNPSLFFKPSKIPSLCHSISRRQIQKPIICARSKKGRSESERSVKLMLQSVYFIASKLNMLPEPLDLMIREFGGGNGGGFWFNKDFGWGGFDGRRRNRKLGILGFVVVLGLGLWLILGKEVDIKLFLGFLVLGLIGVFSAIGLKTNVKDWIVGFCSCAFLVVMGLRKEDLKNWARFFRAADIVSSRRRRRGRALRFWLRCSS